MFLSVYLPLFLAGLVSGLLLSTILMGKWLQELNGLLQEIVRLLKPNKPLATRVMPRIYPNQEN